MEKRKVYITKTVDDGTPIGKPVYHGYKLRDLVRDILLLPFRIAAYIIWFFIICAVITAVVGIFG